MRRVGDVGGGDDGGNVSRCEMVGGGRGELWVVMMVVSSYCYW